MAAGAPGSVPAVELRARGMLFDLDGTLVDSTRSIVRAWTRFAIDFGIRLDHLVAARGHGRRSEDVIADLLPAERCQAAFDRILALEIADLDDLVAVPGAAALLEALPLDSWGIVTSGARPLAATRLEAAGLGWTVPRLLVTGQDVAEGKPHPAAYLAGAAALGLPPADCLAVEDAVAGLASAAAAGMRSIAVTITSDADELLADAVVSDLTSVHVRAAGPHDAPEGLLLDVDTGQPLRPPVVVEVSDDLLRAAADAGDPSAAAALATR